MPNPTCPACQSRELSTDTGRARGMCDDCADGVGTWWTLAQIPPLRPNVPCARCNHPQFVRALVRERAPYGESNTRLKPMSLSYGTQDGGLFVSYREAIPNQPLGILIAYACLGCGFSELYTWLPTSIPIGPQFGTELVDVRGGGPEGGPFR